jgi:hypothetical protein
MRAALADNQSLDSRSAARTGFSGAPKHLEVFLVLSALAAGAVEIGLSTAERGTMVPHGPPQHDPNRME